MKQMTQRCIHLQSEAEAATAQHEASRMNLKHTTAMYQELSEDHRRKQAENDRAAATLSQLTEQLQAHREEIDLVETDCAAERQRTDAAEMKLTELQASKASLQSQLGTALSDLGASQAKCQAKADELLQVQTTIANMDEAAQNLRLQLSNAQGHIDWLNETHEKSQVCNI